MNTFWFAVNCMMTLRIRIKLNQFVSWHAVTHHHHYNLNLEMPSHIHRQTRVFELFTWSQTCSFTSRVRPPTLCVMWGVSCRALTRIRLENSELHRLILPHCNTSAEGLSAEEPFMSLVGLHHSMKWNMTVIYCCIEYFRRGSLFGEICIVQKDGKLY